MLGTGLEEQQTVTVALAYPMLSNYHESLSQPTIALKSPRLTSLSLVGAFVTRMFRFMYLGIYPLCN